MFKVPLCFFFDILSFFFFLNTYSVMKAELYTWLHHVSREDTGLHNSLTFPECFSSVHTFLAYLPPMC